ncbi:Hypothetical predicted protein, partial [Pelobates cultripes]
MGPHSGDSRQGTLIRPKRRWPGPEACNVQLHYGFKPDQRTNPYNWYPGKRTRTSEPRSRNAGHPKQETAEWDTSLHDHSCRRHCKIYR